MFRHGDVRPPSSAGSGRRIVLIIPAIVLLTFNLVTVLKAGTAPVVTDPGVRSGLPGAGGPVAGLTADQLTVWNSSTRSFKQVSAVSGKAPIGLGPRFNSNSCASCHAQPAIGGASPVSNPLFSVFQLDGAENIMPFFESTTGPALHARFPFLADQLTPDATVHQLFTITGRSDAGDCNLSQPTFQSNNLATRNPLPLFGDGLVEFILSADILNNMTAECAAGAGLGICGTPSFSGNDHSVKRLGWKAQDRSLLLAAGLWYNVELGVTNELFPNELDETPGCASNPLPESSTNFNTGIQDVQFPGDPERMAIFMRFLAPPVPGKCPGGNSASCSNGETQFNTIGCVLCHTTSFTTPANTVTALSKIQANLFSDLLLHHMGPCLADNIVMGAAQGDMFRTPPLWGAGKRIFFLHDGSETDIVQTIQDHFCAGNLLYPASEANAVVNNFNALSPRNQQDLINFLRSL